MVPLPVRMRLLVPPVYLREGGGAKEQNQLRRMGTMGQATPGAVHKNGAHRVSEQMVNVDGMTAPKTTLEDVSPCRAVIVLTEPWPYIAWTVSPDAESVASRPLPLQSAHVREPRLRPPLWYHANGAPPM